MTEANARGGRPRSSPRRGALALIVAVALGLYAPFLWAGYLADDFGLQAVLDGRIESATWRPWSLYDFGRAADAPSELVEASVFPWWIDADWSVRFQRPLTSLSLWLDHALFGSNAVAGHAVQLAMFALLLRMAHGLYRRIGLEPLGALLAVAILAFDNGALMPVGWIANRNSLLEALFAVGALNQALHARSSNSTARWCTAFALALCALAAKESGLHALLGLAALAYGPRRRWAWTAAVIAAVYLVAYAAFGLGSNVLFYPTPWDAPAAFAASAATMIACAPLAAIAPIPVDALGFAGAARGYWVVGIALVGACVVVCFVQVLARDSKARTWAALSLLALAALLPQAGAPASDRLMFTPMLYLAPVIAAMVVAALSRHGAGVSSGTRAAGWTMAAFSLVLSPLVVASSARKLSDAWQRLRDVIRGADVGPASAGERHAYLLQASPSALLGLGPAATWWGLGGDAGVRWHPLQAAPRAIDWSRSSERAFAIETSDESFLEAPFERVYRTRELEGARQWRAPGMVVRGRTDERGELRRLEFELDRSLDDPSIRFLLFDGTRLLRVEPPAIGETRELPRGERDSFLP